MESVRSKKLLKLKGHHPGSNRRTLDHKPTVIPMSYCGRGRPRANSNNMAWHDFLCNFMGSCWDPRFNSYCGRNFNHAIWHEFYKTFKWLKFFQKWSAPKLNIGLSDLVFRKGANLCRFGAGREEGAHQSQSLIQGLPRYFGQCLKLDFPKNWADRNSKRLSRREQ